MILDKSLDSEQRMAQNIAHYAALLKYENDKTAIRIMIESFSEILNETIKKRFVQSFERDNSLSHIAFSETSNFNAKIETCYEFKAFGEDVRAILHQFDLLKDDFISFNDFNARCYIKEILRLSQSDLLHLILTLIDKRQISGIKCSNMTELLDSLGYKESLKFIFTILAAALIENLLMI